MPFETKTLLLAVSLFLFLILNAVGARAQTTDDHGNTFGSATPLSLGSSIAGRIDPGDDVDVFKLDLSGRSGTTDVWIYTAGELDTWGGLYDGSAATAFLGNDNSFIVGRSYNFHIRASLAPGTYYVGVFSADGMTTGDYTLHTEVVIDPGSSINSAKAFNLSTPTAGTIGFYGDTDYFKLDLTKATHLYIYALSVHGEQVVGFPVDVGDTFVPSNTHIGRNGFAVRDHFGPGTHYIKIFTLSSVTSHPVPYTIHAYEETDYPTFLEDCQTKTNALNNPQVSDSLYGCQWHLRNLTGEDINVEPVWAEGITGQGINIALVDDGMDFNHEDLRDNVNTSLNHDYTDIGSIFNPFRHHGTYMAGIIAARDNGIGVRGVAPRGTIFGYNYLAQPTIFSESDAMTRNSSVTAVSNNSWGIVNGPGLGHASSFWELAVVSGANSGYGGKGTFYAFAGGNGHQEGGHSNLNEYANHYAVTAVCGTNDIGSKSSFSALGANLWVCAPSGDLLAEGQNIVTTENYDRYIYGLSGTSASTAIVSGVAALMRQANPDLTWRDLKLILAASARKNDPTNTGWEDGSRKYGSTSAADRYHFNHEYGFGVVDAKAAVDTAKGWTNAPPLKSAGAGFTSSTTIPAPGPSGPTAATTELTLSTDIGFIEFVEINADFEHTSFRDMEIELVAPSGAISKLTVPFNTRTDEDDSLDFVRLDGEFRFGSARHLGENPNGKWQLRLSDHYPIYGGTLRSWSIEVYGHSGTPVDTTACATGGAVTNASSNPGLVSDCETLLDARDTLVGTGTSLDWSPNTPMTSWDGVTVEGTPARVTQISLQNRGLRGTIPAQLGSLTALRGLRLDTTPEVCQGNVCRDTLEHERNRLTGPIPPALGSLTRLEWLALTRNQLTGPIPTELRSLTRLSLLALGGNQLTGAVPSWLGSLNSLTELYLWDNQLNGTIPTELSNLTDLERLTLSNNLLSGQIPSQLGNLSNLQSLRLHDNQFTGTIPASLGNLSNLQYLSLSQNQLSGQIPTQLGSLNSLTDLYLWDNRLSGTIPASLSGLTNLQILSLSQNQLSGTIPTLLGNLSNLRVLYLWGNQLSGTIPASFGNLTDLQHLELNDNQLTGAIPTSLSRLANLESLFLRDNQLTGCILAGLRVVAENDLDELNLPYCDVVLRGLTIDPGSLTPSFDPYHTDYTAMASVTTVTLTPTSAHNATFEFLDVNDSAIADADANLAGHQITLAAQGVTTVKIRVISQDSAATYTYTIQISMVSASGVMATRSFSTPAVAAGGQLVVTIEANNFGSFGGVTETLPTGFSYVSSSLPVDLVVATGQEVRFTLFGESNFTYTVTASNTAGSYSFSGVLKDSTGIDYQVAGPSVITVGDAPSVAVSRVTPGVIPQIRINSPIPLTATFSEPVFGFTVGDITVTNGFAGNFVGSDGDSIYTFDVTPNAIGVVAVDIAADVALDADSKGNIAAIQLSLSIPYDDDHDGAISRDEVITAIGDYLFSGTLTRDQVIAIIGLYLFG